MSNTITVETFDLPRDTRDESHQIINFSNRVPVVDVPSGDGLVYQTALAVESKNKNFLEGCYHLYTPHDQAFPGTVLSTGTEDCTFTTLLLLYRHSTKACAS